MNKPVLKLKYSLAGAVYETVGFSGPHFSVICVNDESGVKLTLIPSRPITLISAALEFWHEYEENEKFFVNGYQSWTTSAEMSSEDIYPGVTSLAGITKTVKDMAITPSPATNPDPASSTALHIPISAAGVSLSCSVRSAKETDILFFIPIWISISSPWKRMSRG